MSGDPFVFLDRDGTLVEDCGYGHRLTDYRLLPGVVEGLRRLADAGFRLVIVTNQSGIGRGYFELEDYERFQRHLLDDLARHDLRIERSYVCPHHPDDGCACRKPGTALLERARDELGADLAASWVIGDKLRDVEMAVRAGCAGGVWVGREDPRAQAPPTGVVDAKDLVEAATVILAGDVPAVSDE